MIYWELLWGFLRVGLLAFGGAYAAIPFIRDVVMDYGWLTEEAFANFVAVSESTPGPIMVNLATYIGKTQGGLPGAVIATAGTVLPAFVITVVISGLMKTYVNHPVVRAVLQGVRAAIVGIILATGAYMLLRELYAQGAETALAFKWPEIAIAAALAALMFAYKKLTQKPLSPILLILIAAVMGIAVFALAG